MTNQYRTLANQFIREHVEKSQWSAFDRVECRAMQMFAEWLDARAADEPTAPPLLLAAEINALPKRVRDYIHHLETDADPAGDKWRLAAAEERVAALTVMLAEAAENRPADPLPPAVCGLCLGIPGAVVHIAGCPKANR